MPKNSPILNLLQFTQERSEGPPIYQVECIEENPRLFFKCLVKACSIEAIGYGTTSQNAREEAARAALQILIPPCTSTENETLTPRPNHVEQLNSFVNKHGLLYGPTYYDIPFLGSSVVCLTICRVECYTVEGYGADPMESKDDAARNMLYVLSLIGDIPTTRPSREQTKSRSPNPKRRSQKISVQYRLDRIKNSVLDLAD
ncbi:uncharacterized protein LOC108910651 [Anoplophora glabripennis]|uniref:uncharacterized protein LOC108910651 n=1 Tax=Anoplophora glabripennis TaxID=217634 RepID=UPI0008737739|nr:uncharacterized protein LOC108910651 [Anoplophora glabripennis]